MKGVCTCGAAILKKQKKVINFVDVGLPQEIKEILPPTKTHLILIRKLYTIANSLSIPKVWQRIKQARKEQ